eukprot:s585_g21.t1
MRTAMSSAAATAASREDVETGAAKSRDDAFMECLRRLAREALTWLFLDDRQRLVWTAVLEFDADLPPWFYERQNFTRRHLGVDLFSLDGKTAVLCRAADATLEDVKRFLRTAKCISEAAQCTLLTFRGCKIADVAKKWLCKNSGHHQILTKRNLSKLQSGAGAASDDLSSSSEPPLRCCQKACLEACAKGARVIEMACGTGKTRVIRELAAKQPGKVLVTVPSRVLLDQFSEELPGFCKVGMQHNDKIDMESQGFVAVTKSVQLLQNVEFEAVFIDEAHHPLPKRFPRCREVFKFSATHKEEVDFRYSLGEAIEQGVLCDYDLTVPVVTDGHPYVCLANLLLSQAGRFRRMLAYCNSIAEARRFRQVLETVGLAAWHINGETSGKERERVMNEFSGELRRPGHVLVTVQVLGEGVNIPNADTCMFVEPRSSYVSIIQAIGRVLRPHPSKPMAHVVLPAIVISAGVTTAHTTRRSLGDKGQSQSSGCVDEQHVRALESPLVRTQPGQGEISKATVGAETAWIIHNGPVPQSEETCADCGGDSISPAQWAQGVFNLRSQGNSTNRPRSCDPKSDRKTSHTDDREDVVPSTPIATVSNEDAPVVPIGGFREDAPTAPLADTAISGLRANADDRQAKERASRRSLASTASIPARAYSEKDGALAACNGKQTATSWNARARGQRAAAQNNRIDIGGEPPSTESRAEGRRDRRDCYSLPTSAADGGSQTGSKFQGSSRWDSAGRSSQSSASMTDGQRKSGRRMVSAWHTPTELSAAAAPLDAGPGTKPGPSTEKDPGKLMCCRASKPKVKTADVAGLFGSGHVDQLDRFIEAIARADSRFADKDIRLLQSRLCVMDCRVQQPTMQQPLTRDIQYQLALILQQRDAFDLRLQAVEKFDQDHGRLPRQASSQLEEITLGNWLRNLGYSQKQRTFSAEKMQKLLKSSCSRLRARAAKWLEPDASFKLWLMQLRQFVHAHGRMPSTSRENSRAEQHLRKDFLNLVNPANSNYQRSRRKLEVRRANWNRKFDRLLEFAAKTAGFAPLAAPSKAVFDGDQRTGTTHPCSWHQAVLLETLCHRRKRQCSGMVQLCRQHLLLGLPVVLGVCLHLSLAARASSWEDEPQQGRSKPNSDRETWGDFFSDLNDVLRMLDVVWFVMAATIALALACWKPSQIVGDTSQVGSDGVKWTPPPWYTLTTIFASLSSHAAGILGFVGFRKIVVARIVSTSQPRANWSAPNFLLLTSIAISITAIFSSLVCLGLWAWTTCADWPSTRTGLGMALIMLTFLLIAQYMLVIYTERQNSKKQEASPDSAVNDSRDMKIFLDKACSCATVLLYFFNLRSLCESPKVQFHQTVASAGEDLEQINIKDYLTKFCSRRAERSNIRTCMAYLAHGLAGEDIGLLVKMGTRRAIFPNQRLAPLLNVVGIVMLFGMVPGIFQFATEQLFVDPQILEVRAISAHLLPAFDAESGRKEYVLLLDKDPRLQVKTKSAQTSSIEICCVTDPDNSTNCTDYPLRHSLIQFDEKPTILKIPASASAKCSLTAKGLSQKSWTTLDLMVELKTVKRVCDCHKNTCSCCDGYEGEIDAEGEEVQNMLSKGFCTPVPCGIDRSNQKPGPDCKCNNGYVGDIVWEGANVSGNCTPAPCYIENSNRKPGLQCQCKEGFSGEVQWDQSVAFGECLPADCGILNSIGMGPDCKCTDGYDGNIRWNRSQPHGVCEPATGCTESIANSMGVGLQCECKDGFSGNIRWHGSVPQGSCQAAECNIVNSNQQPGLGCRCLDGYQGEIKWQRDRARGPCTPAPCAIENSSQKSGQECACLMGYTGEITWKGETAQGQCKPASCANIANTTGSGTQCRCRDGFEGTVTWSGANASGECKPATCTVFNSDKEDGLACKCLEGFHGGIGWQGSESSGICMAMECTGPHSNGRWGLIVDVRMDFTSTGRSRQLIIGAGRCTLKPITSHAYRPRAVSSIQTCSQVKNASVQMGTKGTSRGRVQFPAASVKHPHATTFQTRIASQG